MKIVSFKPVSMCMYLTMVLPEKANYVMQSVLCIKILNIKILKWAFYKNNNE